MRSFFPKYYGFFRKYYLWYWAWKLKLYFWENIAWYLTQKMTGSIVHNYFPMRINDIRRPLLFPHLHTKKLRKTSRFRPIICFIIYTETYTTIIIKQNKQQETSCQSRHNGLWMCLVKQLCLVFPPFRLEKSGISGSWNLKSMESMESDCLSNKTEEQCEVSTFQRL